jgi:hypothetical protein
MKTEVAGSVQRMGDDDTRGTLGRVDSRRGKANAMGVAVATGEDDRCPSTDLIGDLPAGRSCRHREPGFDLTRSEAGSGERSTRGGFWAGRQPWAAATVLPVLRRQCHLKDWRGHRIATLFGKVTVPLPRFLCHACNRTETGVCWPSRCRSTPGAGSAAAHLSALMTYRVAVDVLQRLLPIDAGRSP